MVTWIYLPVVKAEMTTMGLIKKGMTIQSELVVQMMSRIQLARKDRKSQASCVSWRRLKVGRGFLIYPEASLTELESRLPTKLT